MAGFCSNFVEVGDVLARAGLLQDNSIPVNVFVHVVQNQLAVRERVRLVLRLLHRRSLVKGFKVGRVNPLQLRPELSHVLPEGGRNAGLQKVAMAADVRLPPPTLATGKTLAKYPGEGSIGHERHALDRGEVH